MSSLLTRSSSTSNTKNFEFGKQSTGTTFEGKNGLPIFLSLLGLFNDSIAPEDMVLSSTSTSRSRCCIFLSSSIAFPPETRYSEWNNFVLQIVILWTVHIPVEHYQNHPVHQHTHAVTLNVIFTQFNMGELYEALSAVSILLKISQ